MYKYDKPIPHNKKVKEELNMQIREEKIDSLYMDIIDILGKNCDIDLATAANVAEQITEMVNELYEHGE